MASVPTLKVSDQEEEPPVSRREKTDVRPGSLLSVPSTARSNIGINNPAQLGGGGGLLSVGGGGGLFPLPSSQQVAGGSATGNPRNKVSLGPGFSLMDWVRLTKSGKDLSGVGGPMVKGRPREVTRQELRKHRKRKDAWMALNGAVYNVTQYMDFHPGGWDELVKGAGRDATDMFNEIHKWVNYQGMMEACLVGKLVDGPSGEEMPAPALPPPPVLPPIPTRPALPTMDFFQTDSKITINVYTKRKGLKKQNVIIDNNEDRLRVSVLLLKEEIFILNVKLSSAVERYSVIRIGESSGKLEIDLKKSSPGRWQSLGTPLQNHLWFGLRKDVDELYLDWVVRSSTPVTHNTVHLVVSPPAGCHLRVGVGQHVAFRTVVEGQEFVRSYTPVLPLVRHSQREEEGEVRHSQREEEGVECLQFLIKVYPDGVTTPLLGQLRSGDLVSVSSPQGDFQLSSMPSSPGSQLYLLAAGTGITPILGLLSALHLLPVRPAVKLITFDRTEPDMIWRREISQFQTENSDWLSLVQVLSQPSSDWRGEQGRVNTHLLSQHIAGAGDSRWAAVCGPPGFNLATVRVLMDINSLAFRPEQIRVFEG